MPVEFFYTVKDESVSELVEKKSRFIAHLRPVANEAEALEFISEMKKKFWDARHNCSAYIVKADDEGQHYDEKCSDDGEPSRTAGSPMLEVLKGAGLKNVCVVVTRYFGGVLLGTGGLVRAYSGAAAQAVEAAEIIKMQLQNRVSVKTDYNGYGRLQYFVANEGLVLADTEFSDSVNAVVLCDDAGLGSLRKKMNEATAGKAEIEIIDRGFYETPDK